MVIKLDEIDYKIIEVLREEEGVNMSRLILKTFARESGTVFRKRLDRLEKGRIININSIKWAGTGKGYLIKLTKKFKK